MSLDWNKKLEAESFPSFEMLIKGFKKDWLNVCGISMTVRLQKVTYKSALHNITANKNNKILTP